jgi:hypothetical protein
METVTFIVVAVALYFLSDWILRRLEAAAGRVFENRSLIFFGILLVSALASFWLIRSFFGDQDGAPPS